MDYVLNYADYYFFTPYVYPSTWPEDDIFRQTISLLIVTNLGAFVLYFLCATLSYYFVYDHSLMKHPLFLENQVYREIKFTVQSMPWISIPTVALFLLEVKGYSKLYDNIEFPHGWFHLIVSIISFLFFTDMLIYWIHRGLHHKLIYKHVHKPHHIWKIPTPFASHAFHPLDGFLQSLPYHIYPFIFPLHKLVYLGLYIAVNVWTISIHDGDFRVPQILRPFINGSAHHTDHHLFFDYNYGQYFTLWDRIGGSFKNPSAFEGKGPLSYVKSVTEEKCSNPSNDYKNEKFHNGVLTKIE
ncbi:lathosterol oxidase [Octodon degus]|uniref:Lathosterol oxidase n=1 Tax=Octodon degus TaxID=10160 RepID=A0A6P3F1G6_OCTDE|nr:lathosterol oxidase [Octodon degus]XP_023576936.1 lathosterol oxidase [Octodon degus]